MNLSRGISYVRAVMGITHGSRAFGGPVQAAIDVTNRCNVQCIHCYFYSPYLHKPNFESLRKARQRGMPLPDDEALRRTEQAEIDAHRLCLLIEETLKMGTRRFQLSGGEPLLHKELLDSVARIKHAGAFCFLNTNGTKINKHTAEAFITLGIDELRITLMAGTPEVYLRTHPGVSKSVFESIRDSLIYIADQKRQRDLASPKIFLAFIVTSQNKEDLLRIAEFADEVGANGVLYRPVDDIEDEGLARVVPTAEEASFVRKQLPEVKAFLESKGIAHNIPNFEKVFGTQLDTRRLYRLIPCYYGWLSVRISAEGDVYPCCRCYQPMGNIYEQTFSEIWYGEMYRRFRKEALKLPGQDTPISDCDCFSCVHHTANLRVYNALHPITRSVVKKKMESFDDNSRKFTES